MKKNNTMRVAAGLATATRVSLNPLPENRP